MPTEKLVTQSYVLTEGGDEHKLEYYLVSHPMQNDFTVYGITIKQYISDEMHWATETVFGNEANVLQVIDHFARSFVFPSSLCDLIEDME